MEIVPKNEELGAVVGGRGNDAVCEELPIVLVATGCPPLKLKPWLLLNVLAAGAGGPKLNAAAVVGNTAVCWELPNILVATGCPPLKLNPWLLLNVLAAGAGAPKLNDWLLPKLSAGGA